MNSDSHDATKSDFFNVDFPRVIAVYGLCEIAFSCFKLQGVSLNAPF